ncbi:MAG TPA: hypothetical protein VFA41_22890 [Ktedonobacteraceae bacterium]|jgi:uncharacterized membrane protein (DUF2068 family)|nr:hypothetical protein [Ktedonobacteraceae bacterium]
MQQAIETHRRPLGVTIVAAILAIHGILDLIAGGLVLAAALALGHVAAVHGHTTTGSVIDVIGGVIGGVTLLIGIVKLICPVGLLLLKRWAYWLAILIEVVSVIKHGVELARPQTQGYVHIALIIIPLALAVIILLYLLIDPNVRRAFFR